MADIKTFGILTDNESQETRRILFDIAQWDSDPWVKGNKNWDSDNVGEATISHVLDNAVDTKILTVRVKASEKEALNAYILLEKAEKSGEKARADKEGALDRFQLNVHIDGRPNSITFKEPKVKVKKTESENRTNFLTFTVKTMLTPIKNGAAI